jgi:ComF family protein
MIGILNTYIYQGLDWLLPPRCVITGAAVDVQGALAPEAWRELSFITAPMCQCCGRPFSHSVEADSGDGYCAGCLAHPPAFDRARAALIYNDASRELVLSFKHGDHTYLWRTMTNLMLTAGGAELCRDADVITPVPLHRWRLLRRRYNQAALLARGLAKRCHRPFTADILQRSRATASQGHLSGSARRKNVKGAFLVRRKWRDHLKGNHVVLVDDVFTTGATVEECARILKKHGADKVSVLTLTRTDDAHRL